jgi:hypothetical protein
MARALEGAADAAPGERRAELVAGCLSGLPDWLAADPAILSSVCGRMIDGLTMPEGLVDPAAAPQVIPPGEGPVVVGPWLWEVGFELLYWIPYVRAILRNQGVTPDRVVVLSRGGVRGWYEGIADGYRDILDIWDADMFRARMEERAGEGQGRKAFSMDATQMELATLAMGMPPGEGRYHLVAPSALFGRYRVAWRSRVASQAVLDPLAFAPLVHPAPLEGAPKEPYVAVKLYFSDCFPDTLRNRQFCLDLIRTLAEFCPVVVLGLSARMDDHETVFQDMGERVIDGSRLYDMADNLGAQTALIAHALGLVATHGGFSYLAHLLGKPCLQVVDLPATVNPVHEMVEAALVTALSRPVGARLSPESWALSMAGGAVQAWQEAR